MGSHMSDNNKQPKKTDPNAPRFLEITVTDSDGKIWGKIIANDKIFSSGSIGYYAGAKIQNPESGERYQIGLNATLIGSKPDKE